MTSVLSGQKASSKRQKIEEVPDQIVVEFVNPEGVSAGPQIDLPLGSTREQLQDLLNKLLESDEPNPYSFTLNENAVEITTSLADGFAALKKIGGASSERVLRITFYPLAVFRVRPVTRCTASLQGHSEAVLCASFSPDGAHLATGSGDTTVRLWDLSTECPDFTCKGHKNWVLCVMWAPDASRLASSGMDKTILIWDPKTGKQMGKPLTGHSKPVTCLAWQPQHLVTAPQTDDADAVGIPRLASASKDFTIRVWDVLACSTLLCLSGHGDVVTQVLWSGEGEGLLYSASRDRTVKVWNPSNGKMCKELKGHAHWVNSLALNTEHALRTGAFSPTEPSEFASYAQKIEMARKRYETFVKACGGEKLLSGSDDFTMFLWNPADSRKPICRMTGHQKVVNHVSFSPDGRMIASASFDKSIRLWDGRTGKYIATLRGHVGDVYQARWSADGRMLVTGSKDSTVKVWDVGKRKLLEDLPGHADEVFAIDWSPDGARVASGSKDRTLKIWRH